MVAKINIAANRGCIERENQSCSKEFKWVLSEKVEEGNNHGEKAKDFGSGQLCDGLGGHYWPCPQGEGDGNGEGIQYGPRRKETRSNCPVRPSGDQCDDGRIGGRRCLWSNIAGRGGPDPAAVGRGGTHSKGEKEKKDIYNASGYDII